MDTLFHWCVDLLSWLAPILGMTYNEINIWTFVIIEPLVFMLMLFVIIFQARRIRLLKSFKEHL